MSGVRGNYTNDSDVEIVILTESDWARVKKYSDRIDDISTRIAMDTLAVVYFVCLPFAKYEEKKVWYPYFMNFAKDGVLLYMR